MWRYMLRVCDQEHAKVLKLEAFAKVVIVNRTPEYNHAGHSDLPGDCEGPLRCIVCAAEEALS